MATQKKKKITFIVEPGLHEKFSVALMLTGETQAAALNKCLKEYISKVFQLESEKYSSASPLSTETPKAIKRIPRWANNPDQINHKIIRAYFTLSDSGENVTVYDMERLCLDRSHPETYAPTFRNNFAQMKIETPKSTGKVFEEKNGFVHIWERVENTLLEHIKYFIQPIEQDDQ